MKIDEQPQAPYWRSGLDRARAAERCHARRKSDGNPCLSPAMTNGRCRMHGGKSPGAPTGKRNGNYRHGRETHQAKAERKLMWLVTRGLLSPPE